MKYYLLLIFSPFLILNAQTLDLNHSVPIDSTIKKGVLSNGMTYYLHNTDATKDVASFYIIQNVGSVLENDDQQGLAHFLEHMAFNGTESFPKKTLLEKLQNNGLLFGTDINAYTDFDETVYNINNLGSTPELLDLGLQVLHDWSNYLLLTDEEIDAERAIIKEEWRTRQNGSMRIFKKTLSTAFGNSLYASRMPIGLMDIVENFEYKALRDFYHDWYRTDLQAIAVIGDFDTDKMEKKIKAKFSTIPAIKNPLERFKVSIEDNEKLVYDIAMDKEITSSSISFFIRQDKIKPKNTVGYLRENLINNMINSMLSFRFGEISKKIDAPINYLSGGIGSLSLLYSKFGLGLGAKPNQQKDAFTLAMNELNRAVKFGFTKSEIKRTIDNLSNFYENQILSVNKRPHGQIQFKIQKNYLENIPLTDVKKEYDIVKKIFESLTQDDFLKQLKQLYIQKNRSVIVTGVDGEANITESDVIAIIKAAETNTDLQPYEEQKEQKEQKELISDINIVPGKIISQTKDPVIGYTTFKLSNGIDVYYKYSEKSTNKVILQAESYGGTSLLKPAQLPSTIIISQLTQQSGIGVMSSTELENFLAGKTVSSNLNISEGRESLSFNCAIKDVETMLQLTNLKFTKPRFDKEAFDRILQDMTNALAINEQNLNARMNDSITTSVYGKNNPKRRVVDKQYISEISFEEAQAIYKERFANAADFKFFIVGDVTKEALMPLLKKYIASIPTTYVKERKKDRESVKWVRKNIDKDIYLPMEDPKSNVNITIRNKKINYNIKNDIVVSAIGDILQLRYTESLREEEGGTYSPSVSSFLAKNPSFAAINVNFDCNPDLLDKLLKIVYHEIDKLKKGVISQKDLNRVLSSKLKGKEFIKNYSAYDMFLMKEHVLEHTAYDAEEKFKNILNAINIKDIKRVANKLFTNYKSYEIVFKPLNL